MKWSRYLLQISIALNCSLFMILTVTGEKTEQEKIIRTVTLSQMKTVTKTITTSSPAATNSDQLNPQFLKDFKLILPIGHNYVPLEISMPLLESYRHVNYFFFESDSILIMKTPAGGVTSLESEFPATGLIEMYDNDVASWDPTQGVHVMNGKLSLHHLNSLIPEISVAEICSKNETILQLALLGNGDIIARRDGNDDRIGQFILEVPFSFKFVVNQTNVKVFLNDNEENVYEFDEELSSTLYFRVGSFPQSGVAQGEDPFDYSEVWLHNVNLMHQNYLHKRSRRLILPSQILDLSVWKLTLPIGSTENPIDIHQPELNLFHHITYFYEKSKAVVFIANCGGVTTANSKYPRSELREMNLDGSLASWSAISGYHFLSATISVNSLPKVKPETCVIQIHDLTQDIIEIVVNPVSVRVRFFGITRAYLDRSYALGEKFNIAVEVNAGIVNIYYKDMLTPAVKFAYGGLINFYKLGNYVQSNPTKGDAPDAYAEVWVYDYMLWHREETSPTKQTVPSSIINLEKWSLLLPVGTSKDPTTINQLALAKFSRYPYFYGINEELVMVSNCGGSIGAKKLYPRTEITENIVWSSFESFHSLSTRISIKAIPKVKPTLGIIELRNSQITVLEIKLEKSKLVAVFSNTTYQIDTKYKLGTEFALAIELEHKFISIIYNDLKVLEVPYSGDGNYFAFGALLKCNNKSGGISSSFGELSILKADLLHASENPYRLLPGSIIDLSSWNLQIPKGGPDTILPPKLYNFDDQKYFYVHNQEVIMSVNCGGIPMVGSKFPRTEMTELKPDNTRASWSSTVGKHSLKSRLSITNLPKKRPKMAISQIRNRTTNILQLNIDNGVLLVVYSDKSTLILDSNYVLGKIIEVEIHVRASKISILYNGILMGEKSYSGLGNFFKYGPYLMTNVVDYSEEPEDYGEMKVYSLIITHN